jgi:octaprenyl-diphosphate synthase
MTLVERPKTAEGWSTNRPALALPQIQALASADMAAVDALIRDRLASDVVLFNLLVDDMFFAAV